MANQPFLIGALDIADEYMDNAKPINRQQDRIAVNLRDPRVRNSLRLALNMGFFTKECEERLNSRGVFRVEEGEDIRIIPQRAPITPR